MAVTVSLQLRTVHPEELYDLRRRVLRMNDPLADVSDPRDHDSDACHLHDLQEMVIFKGFTTQFSPLSPNSQFLALPLKHHCSDRDHDSAVLTATVLDTQRWETRENLRLAIVTQPKRCDTILSSCIIRLKTGMKGI